MWLKALPPSSGWMMGVCVLAWMSLVFTTFMLPRQLQKREGCGMHLNECMNVMPGQLGEMGNGILLTGHTDPSTEEVLPLCTIPPLNEVLVKFSSRVYLLTRRPKTPALACMGPKIPHVSITTSINLYVKMRVLGNFVALCLSCTWLCDSRMDVRWGKGVDQGMIDIPSGLLPWP